MEVDRLLTPMGILLLVVSLVPYAYWALKAPLGSFSLPCLTLLTSMMYFQILPAVTLADGDPGYFGVYMSDMTWAHVAALLYIVGAMFAFESNRKTIFSEPIQPAKAPLNKTAFAWMWGLAGTTVVIQFILGKLNLLYDDRYSLDVENINQLSFISLGNQMLVALALVYLARDRFGWRSLAAAIAVLAVFLQVGFRTPLIYILGSGASMWLVQRGFRPRLGIGVAAVVVGLTLAFVLGTIRDYGRGIDTANLTIENISATATRGGGELGVAYALDAVANNPLPELNWYEPWVVGVLGFVPGFIWPDKPRAESMRHLLDHMAIDAEKAGAAAPQHVEFLYQLGWFGILPLAFLYFSWVCWSIRKLNAKGGEMGLVWATLAPIFFGFHMQTRGYFFQCFIEGLSIYGTLYLMCSEWPSGGSRLLLLQFRDKLSERTPTRTQARAHVVLPRSRENPR